MDEFSERRNFVGDLTALRAARERHPAGSGTCVGYPPRLDLGPPETPPFDWAEFQRPWPFTNVEVTDPPIDWILPALAGAAFGVLCAVAFFAILGKMS